MNLSPHFTLSEFEATTTHLPNAAPPSAVTSLRLLCARVLEPLRAAWGVPVKISSGFRSVAVNAAIKGAKRSQHLYGCAADVVPIGMPIEEAMRVAVAEMLREGLPVGQIIVYPNAETPFIHVSIDLDRDPRQEALTTEAPGGSGGPYRAWVAPRP